MIRKEMRECRLSTDHEQTANEQAFGALTSICLGDVWKECLILNQIRQDRY